MVLSLSVSGLGVNWGTISINPLPLNYVVKMLQANNITKVKLFDANYDVVRSLAGTDIEVMVAAPNDLLATLASSPDAADTWVEQNITSFSGVNITYVFQSSLIASFQSLLDITKDTQI